MNFKENLDRNEKLSKRSTVLVCPVSKIINRYLPTKNRIQIFYPSDMAICVFKFPRRAYKITYIDFWPKINILQGNYYILRIHIFLRCQKWDIILEKTVC